MKTITFSTGNPRKIREAKAGCAPYDIEVETIELHFNEIQSHDPLAISLQKVEDAFALAGVSSIVVADTSWEIPALNGFPGGYMKDVAEWFAPEDFIALLANKPDKTIIFRESIVYKDATEVKVFSKEYKGNIAASPRGLKGNSLDKVAEFDGRTLSESNDLNTTSHNPEDFVWGEFAEWFSQKLT